MHRIIKQVAAALALVPLFVLSGCSGGAPVYVAGPETEALSVGRDSDKAETMAGEEAVFSEQAGTGSSEGTDSQRSAGYVYVCGAVVNPGVYPIAPQMRVFEAIALAGGFSREADEEWLNQALAVQDGQRLYVYSKEETRQMRQEGITGDGELAASGDGAGAGAADAAAPAGSGSAGGDGAKININTAGREELMTLPGIGEAKAEAVIQYRTEHGSFASIEEIQNISGIKTAVFSKIRDLITV